LIILWHLSIASLYSFSHHPKHKYQLLNYIINKKS
jgi:hypothetical protein